MIGYLEGTVAERTANRCLVATSGGVGYWVFVPSHTMAQLPAKGGRVAFYTNLIVREDALELFGFQTVVEQETFDILISISKVGAKTALAILSLFRPEDLERIVADDDALVLVQVPGIGKKTAQHVFLELKDKLKAVQHGVKTGEESGASGKLLRDVLDGLTGLGYEEREVYATVRALVSEHPDYDVSQALRSSLQELSRGKA
ncbi:MAG: Holliday junction branch migration protein RuvA [Desulfovibrio sp.]|nr:Holliday junction branch migration protein RuvA [Desulfovibrio sp.]